MDEGESAELARGVPGPIFGAAFTDVVASRTAPIPASSSGSRHRQYTGDDDSPKEGEIVGKEDIFKSRGRGE